MLIIAGTYKPQTVRSQVQTSQGFLTYHCEAFNLFLTSLWDVDSCLTALTVLPRRVNRESTIVFRSTNNLKINSNLYSRLINLSLTNRVFLSYKVPFRSPFVNSRPDLYSPKGLVSIRSLESLGIGYKGQITNEQWKCFGTRLSHQ